MNTIQINKLSKLHDGKNIIFSKLDLIEKEFNDIIKINNDVILITGNSDFFVDDNLVNRMPSNIKFWFAQNAKTDSNKVIPIPIGLMNYEHSSRGSDHGLGFFEDSQEKYIQKYIKQSESITPTKLIYSNFTIQTNPGHRVFIRDICINTDFIDWVKPDNSIGYCPEFFDPFYNDILNYEAVVCPTGHGIDSHRVYETLYLNRIPIVFDLELYRRLYQQFPVLCLSDANLLKNKNYMEEKIIELKNRDWDRSILTSDFWENKIISKL